MGAKNNLTRVNINLPTELVNAVKKYSNELGINITATYIILLRQALEQQDIMKQLPALLTLTAEIKKAQDTNKLPLN